MSRLVDKIVQLIAPALRDSFLLAFPSEEQPKTTIYFGGNIGEIERGSLGYYFAVKSQKDGNLLASGAENTLQEALYRVFEKMKSGVGKSEIPHIA